MEPKFPFFAQSTCPQTPWTVELFLSPAEDLELAHRGKIGGSCEEEGWEKALSKGGPLLLGPNKAGQKRTWSKVEITLGRPAAVLEQSRSTRASRSFEWRTGASKSAWDFANLLTVGWYGRFKVEWAFCAFRCNSDESVRPNFGQRWKSSRSRLRSPSEFRNYPPRGTPIGRWNGSLGIGGNQGVLWNPYGRNE